MADVNLVDSPTIKWSQQANDVEGRAEQLDDETNTVTAAQARGHIDAANPHSDSLALSEKAAANGVASLDANTEVVERLSYEGDASGVATLNASQEVVERLAYEASANGVATLDASSLLAQAAKLMAQGDAANPGLAFDGDTDTGFYRYAADEIGVAIAAATRVIFRHGGIRVLNGDTVLNSGGLNEFIVQRTDAADAEGRVGISGNAPYSFIFRKLGLTSQTEEGRFGVHNDGVTFRFGGSAVDRNLSERGTNSNGEWFRFYNGTQICVKQEYISGLALDSGTGSLYRSPELARRTFPQAFTTMDASHITIMSGINNAIQWVVTSNDSGASTTYWPKFYILDTGAVTDVDVRVTFFAIGRWY